MKISEKKCIICHTVMDRKNFKGKAPYCNECDDTKDIIKNQHYRVQKNADDLSNEIRWKGAKVIKNYKFEGVIPPPKDISDYIP